MKKNECLRLKGFYENELINRILAFWLPRCEDREYGGFVNCFDNEGKQLISYDKYTWSQGRFVWMFSRLATIKAPIFSQSQRNEFLRLAESGKQFLMRHCLMTGEELDGKGDCAEDVRCVFLMERDGTHKYVDGCTDLDMSVYADCFVVIGMAAYAVSSGDNAAYQFGKRLYESILSRVGAGTFKTLPYPMSSEYRAHGIPMILSNVTREMYDAAQKLDPSWVPYLKSRLNGFSDDILNHFVDENGTVHEVISADNKMIDGLLGQHANPGHTIEDMWFMLDAAQILQKPSLVPRIANIALRALEIGWDRRYGGILHYVHVDGGEPEEWLSAEAREELMLRGETTEDQVLGGFGDKLWWIHSEALYTTLRLYRETGDEHFFQWHERIFEYVFRVFPNQDPEIREWKQICMRDGRPQEKVVALPVKDPFHITRNLILLLELLNA